MSELSEGMKVKFQLALALSHRAELLILDEPTSGLDPVSRDDLLELFLTLSERGTAILFSTHITSDLEKCADTITYLQNGRVRLTSTREDILAQWRVVTGKASQRTASLNAVMTGCREHRGEFEGLVRAQDAKIAAGCSVRPATLEELMVFLEREAEA